MTARQIYEAGQTFLPAQNRPASDGQAPFSALPLASAPPNDNPSPHPPLETGRFHLLDYFRLADAIPQDKFRAWQQEQDFGLRLHPDPWGEKDWKEYDQRIGNRMEAWLHAGLGCRVLARPDVCEAVKRCVLRFDDDRLPLHAAVIMPKHVHLLLEPFKGHDLSKLLQGVKGASALEANAPLRTAGTFWLDESYDHIVRSGRQYQHFVSYIADNPLKAALREDE